MCIVAEQASPPPQEADQMLPLQDLERSCAHRDASESAYVVMDGFWHTQPQTQNRAGYRLEHAVAQISANHITRK